MMSPVEFNRYSLKGLVAALALSAPVSALSEEPAPSPAKETISRLEDAPTAYKAGRRIATKNHQQLSHYQKREDLLAKQENRAARNLTQEAEAGLFYLPESQGNIEGLVLRGQIEARIEAELGFTKNPTTALATNFILGEHLCDWWSRPTSIAELVENSRDRRLSPPELEVKILQYRDLCARGLRDYPYMTPEQFDRAIRNFYAWLGPPLYRPAESSISAWKNRLSSDLDQLGLDGSACTKLLSEFDSFYDSLRPRVCPLYSTNESRLLAKYQAQEDRDAEGIRSARNIFVEHVKGSLFTPDLEPDALVVMGAFDPSLNLGSRNIKNTELRPTPEEQARELKAIKEFFDSLEIAPELTEQVIELRKQAWSEMPTQFPERLTKLLYRSPSPEELEVILDYYEASMRESAVRWEVVDARVKACREYYQMRGYVYQKIDDQTRKDLRENYELMMRRTGKLSDREISNRLEQFDREHQ